MKKNFLKEYARDLMAFGSIIFYAIVLVRATIGDFMPFVAQLLIALIILIIFPLIIKHTNLYIARALVLVVFTSLFYKDLNFTVFAAILWIMMLFAALYIKEKKENIAKGVVAGIIATVIGYLFANLLI